HPKHPILLASELAGEAEQQAKDFNRPGLPGKNAVSLFGSAYSWRKEFDWCCKLRDEVYDLIKNHGVPMGLLRKLFHVYWAWKRATDVSLKEAGGMLSLDQIEKKVRWERWRWLLVYSLRSYGGKEAINNRIETIQKMILDESMESRMAPALRWAELSLKSGGEDL
ncbi:MAG TPA: hypothetical protein PLB62_11195, partial [Candidatus Sumerlaeota bacterium]|nr:hypothetical protein [Candidatus Sumerlaeota bacterium]